MRTHPVKLLALIACLSLLVVSCEPGASPGVFDENSITLSLGVVSDVHINTALPVTSQKWESALRQLSAKASESDPDGLDGVLVVGDLIDYPNDDFIKEFKRVYESVLDPVKTPMIYTIGNHDVPQYKWSENMVADAAYLREAFGENYYLADVDKEAGDKMECRHCVIGDYDILSISPNGSGPVVYSPEALKWLDSKLSGLTSKKPSQYIIVITHPMIYGTVYGSLLGEEEGIWKSYLPGYWATKDLSDILSKYPQVVVFGGHLHFPLNDPRSVWQGGYTALGCASVRYMAIEAAEYENMSGQTTMDDKDEFSQGNLLQFDKKGNMRILRMDFYNKDIIGDPLLMSRPMRNGGHLGVYSFVARSDVNEAPALSSLDVAAEYTKDPWRKKEPSGISVSFTSGTDDEFVHHYEISLSRDGEVVATKKILADFYKHPSPSMMKSSWNVVFGREDLPEEYSGNYTVTLTAFDSWDAASEPLTKELSL